MALGMTAIIIHADAEIGEEKGGICFSVVYLGDGSAPTILHAA